MIFLIGALAGIAYGLSAFGGSLVALGLLVLIMAVPIGEALVMNLCMLVVLATITAGDGVRARLPVPGLIWPFALTATALASLGAGFSVSINAQIFSHLLPLIHGLAAIATVLLAWHLGPERAFPRGGLAALKAIKPKDDLTAAPLNAVLLVSAGLGGLLTGLTSASAAIFLVPALAKLVGNVRGQATACAEMAVLPVLLAATATALLMGQSLDWRATGLMIFGALAGLSLARMLAPRFTAFFLHGLVAFALAALAILLGYSVWLA